MSRTIVIDAPAERVWQVVGWDFPRIGDWASSVSVSHPVPPPPGGDATPAGRVCTTGVPLLPTVTERVVAFDDDSRTLSYVAEDLPAFIKEARNRWHVTPLDSHRALVGFEGSIQFRGTLGQVLILPLWLQLRREGRRVLEDLKHFVERGEPSPRKQLRRQRARRR